MGIPDRNIRTTKTQDRMACVKMIPPTPDIAAHLAIRCSTCDEVLHKYGLAINSGNELVRKAAASSGWYVTTFGDDAYCPKCNATRTRKGRPPRMDVKSPAEIMNKPMLELKGGTNMTNPIEPSLPSSVLPPIPKPALVPIETVLPAKETSEKEIAVVTGPAAVKRQRALFDLLDQHFLPRDFCYAVGWSDRRIAEELDCSLEYVIATRRNGWGEIKTAPEIEELLKEIEALRSKAEADVREIRDMAKSALEEIQRPLVSLKDQVIQLRNRLQK